MEFFRRKLKNGIIVIMERRELPIVSVSVTNRYGGGYEKSDIKGIAHFIEHLVFTGTEKRTHEEISREIEKKGGILNAFTAQEVTSFLFELPSEHLFVGLGILSDILKNPRFDAEKFEKEKKVIIEEIRMYHDIPQRHIYEKIEENLFGKPFGEGIIGSEETILRLSRDFVISHFREVYSPENYIVSVVGNADFEEVCEYFEKNFSAGKRKIEMPEIVKKNSESVEERRGIDQAHFAFAVHAPLPGSKKHCALEVLDAYLASGMSSRLFLEIREKRGLAYNVSSMLNSEKNYSYYIIYAGTRKEAISEVKKIILDEFANIEKMSEKNLEEAKERLIGLNKLKSEKSANVMNDLMFEELCGDAGEYYKYEERIRGVDLDGVKKLAKEILKNYSTAAIVPK